MAGYDLKNAEDVQEYLKNLLTEYKFGCYSEKNPEVCHLLGSYVENVQLNNEGAADIFKKNCETHKYAQSCTRYGDFLALGRGVTQDVAKGFEYMRMGCNYNDYQGCIHGGILATKSDQVGIKDEEERIKTGVDMLKKACYEYKLEKACFLLSGIYLGAFPKYIPEDKKEAYKLSLMCCEEGNMYACANIAQMHMKGDGVQKNQELAEAFKARALDLERQMRVTREQVKKLHPEHP